MAVGKLAGVAAKALKEAPRRTGREAGLSSSLTASRIGGKVIRKDQTWLFAFGAVTLLVTAFVYWKYFSPEWKGYQSDFHNLVAEKFFHELLLFDYASSTLVVVISNVGGFSRCFFTAHNSAERMRAA